MLDEATAAAEAMTLALRVGKSESTVLFVADNVLHKRWKLFRHVLSLWVFRSK
jgi:glycine dehydrogenase